MRARFLSFVFAFVFLAAATDHTWAATKKSASTPVRRATPVTPAKPDVPDAYPVTQETGVPQTRAASVLVVDARTGHVLHSQNADAQRQVASTQKLLTALIVAESGGMDEKVRVTAADTQTEPSMLYIKPGEVYRRGDLLRILLVHSMNDVARCLARDNAGSLEAFAARMNARAAQLGMTHSHFVNPNGLPAVGQYSTARDMCKVAMAAYRNRTIRSIVNLKETTWRYNDGRVKNFKNTNRVLLNYALCNGMKTGYTDAAGHCLISSASNSNRDVISVVLGDTNAAIWNDSYRLLNWGLSSGAE